MADIRIGEIGKEHRINCQFDMSNNTSIDFIYTKPNGTLLSVQGVLGATKQTINGALVPANFWASYTFQPGDLDEDGDWNLQIIYNNISPTPVDLFKNLTPITFAVGQ